jgi:hypothetical protein
MRLSEFTLLHHPARLVEKVIIRDRAASDVDGEIRGLTIHMNPSRQEAEALLSKSVEKAIRGVCSRERRHCRDLGRLPDRPRRGRLSPEAAWLR